MEVTEGPGAGSVTFVDEDTPVSPSALPAQVDSAVDLLRGVTERDVADRAEVFDEVHRLLQDALAEVEGG